MNAARSVTVSRSAEIDRRAHTRQQILDATRRLLALGEAFARLSIHRIVNEAGISRATFYLHFRSKRDLIAALGRTETGEWVMIAAPFLSNPKANRKVLKHAIEQLIATWRLHSAVLTGIIEHAEYDEETRFGWRDTIHEIARAVGESIRQRRPRLSAEQAEQRGRLLVWAGERYLHQQTRELSSDSDHLLVESLTDMIWRVMQS